MQFNNYATGVDGGRRGSESFAQRRRKEADKWARIWFRLLCGFHRQPVDRRWRFSQDQVIAFLRSRVEKGDPAKKRLLIVEGLIHFQKERPVDERTDLSFLRRKLKERAGFEAVHGRSVGNGGTLNGTKGDLKGSQAGSVCHDGDALAGAASLYLEEPQAGSVCHSQAGSVCYLLVSFGCTGQRRNLGSRPISLALSH